MKKKNITSLSRRQFLGTSATFLAGVLTAPPLLGAPNIIRNYNKPYSVINGVQIGVITYSFRSLPDQSSEAILKYVKETGINAIELMGDSVENFAGKPKSDIDRRTFYQLGRMKREGETLTEDQNRQLEDLQSQVEAYNKEVANWRNNVSMNKFIQLKKMYNAAGIKIYAFKPNAFSSGNTDAEIDYGLKAAKTLGASHVTLEHPSDDAHTLRLGKLAEKHKVYVAYHGHEQQTPTFWDVALKQSKYNALNLDLGHYVAAGNPDPLELVRSKQENILSMHTKDRQNPENGKSNLPFGKGDTPIIPVLQLMRDQKYKFPATIELEYEVPQDSNPIKEVQKCLEYCRKGLEGK
jgi:sugar phosphate isomerase/epimerase